MGLRCEYFVATDDLAAAAIAEWPMGPSLPPKPRRWGRRAAEPLPTVHAGAIDPVVLMGVLEGLLLSADDEPLMSANAARQVSKSGGGTEPMVFGASDALIDALAGASSDQLSAVAARWAEAEEFGGMADPAELARGLAQLSALSKAARRSNAGLYCWMSL